MPTHVFNPNLLGGQYTTQAELEANQQALANRRAGLAAGFAGGDQWGGGRYGQYVSGMANNAMSEADRGLMLNPIMDEFGAATQQRESQSVDLGGVMQGQGNILAGQEGLYQGQEGLTMGQLGLYEGQEGLYQGQQGLVLGQENLGVGQQNLGMGQQNLAQGQVDLGLQGQQSTQALQEAVGGVQTGVTGVQQSVGQAATGEAPATGLYAGQYGIMADQQAMGNQLGQDIGGISADMANYQRAMEAYQRGADTSRANIQQAGVRGRDQIQRGIGDVGIQANRAAEQMAVARQRMMNTPQGAALFRSAGGVPQQAAQYAQTARNFQGTQQPQQISGPLGPVVTDPRTGLMGQ